MFDWLDIGIFPLALVVFGFELNWAQNRREKAMDERRLDRERKIEDQRAQDLVLQAYLDQMSNLLLEKGLRTSKEDDDVRMLARARTLTVLTRLDPDRKGIVVQFLYEANLLNKENPVVRLGGFSMLNFISGSADLNGIDLSFYSLANIDLSGTKLAGAHLALCDLSGADLSEADLTEADLELSNLTNANLRLTITGNTNLDKTTLDGANLAATNFWSSSLREASLVGANLQEAHLAGSVLTTELGEDAEEGDMGDADLTGADLTEANLNGATITDEQLTQCASLKGAIMPDGTVHD